MKEDIKVAFGILLIISSTIFVSITAVGAIQWLIRANNQQMIDAGYEWVEGRSSHWRKIGGAKE